MDGRTNRMMKTKTNFRLCFRFVQVKCSTKFLKTCEDVLLYFISRTPIARQCVSTYISTVFPHELSLNGVYLFVGTRQMESVSDNIIFIYPHTLFINGGYTCLQKL